MSDRVFKLKSFVNLEGNGQDLEGVMVDTHSATMCSCNHTAWVLLKAMKSDVSVPDLVDKLVEEFDVGQQDARRDVLQFIHQLSLMDLIHETK